MHRKHIDASEKWTIKAVVKVGSLFTMIVVKGGAQIII